MTEKDTFMKLKKISSHELELAINALPQAQFDHLMVDEKAKERFLNSHGWTLKQFIKYSKEKYDR